MRDNPFSLLGISTQNLTPEDSRSINFDWTVLNVALIRSPADPYFEAAFHALWDEFGAKNEMESRAVIEQRLAWRPEEPIDGFALLYELVVVYSADGIAAVHDHTAVMNLRSDDDLIVHLSHILIAPAYRGTGLAGWMRALPLRAARECLRRSNTAARSITLVGEMEPATPEFPDRLKRLRSYERGGYLKIDPAAIHYLQPDFREPSTIDASGGTRPVPLSLIVRRIGREKERTILGHEVRSIAQSLYHLYGQGIRAEDMAPNYESLKRYPPDGVRLELLPPTFL